MFYDVSKWTVGGHSWGANLALVYAMEHPGCVDSLVYIAGSGIHNNRSWLDAFHRNRDEIGETIPNMEYAFNREVNDLGNATLREFGQSPDFYKRVSMFGKSALFVMAKNDIRPSWPVEQLYQLMPDARYVSIPNAEHYIWLCNGEALKAQLLSFWAQKLSKRVEGKMTTKVTVLHGSPRKGNTYRATRIFMDAMVACGDVQFREFFFPESLPSFCTGCQACLGNPHELCPHAALVAPLLEGILNADALILSTPHFSACSMSAGMKNALDHLDFLTMTIAPRAELFGKKAFIITTGAGSTAAIGPIRKYLKNWGMNRVWALGLRMFTNEWDKMLEGKQARFTDRLQRAAQRFYRLGRRRPYVSTLFMYCMSKCILRVYVGEDAYPYQYWREHGYFARCPLWRR